MNKILFLEWKSFGNEYITAEFMNNGYEVVRFPFPRDTEDVRGSSELTERLAIAIMRERPGFVFSFNYFPVAAIACKACKTKYVSWVYDSPYILMYSKTIEYSTNHVFVFDSYECNKFEQMGIHTVQYLPMASATEHYDQMIPDKQRHMKYDSDVTFIGSMYNEKKQHLYRHLEHLDSYTQGYLDGIMEAQKNIYGLDLLEDALKPEIVENMRKVCPVTAHGDGLETEQWVFANYFLARKITATERQEVLNILSKQFRVRLFTPEKTPDLPDIQNMGKIDYYEEAPYAMKCAKINLNISLKSIHTGMPLRALDILGCKGFLLTNFQSDFLEYLEPDKDFVYYDSQAELTELVRYYLTHEEERLQIAENGYKKVKEYLDYKILVKKILEAI